MLFTSEIKNRRDNAKLARQDLAARGHGAPIDPALIQSWQRSRCRLSTVCDIAPLMDSHETRDAWLQSPISQYCQPELQMMAETADQNRMIAAVADNQGRILWVSGRDSLCSWGEQVNFVPSGCWGEDVMGTNALSLALDTGRTVNVLAEEHYLSCIEGWVCYAAPIIDPRSGQKIGVIDLSSPAQNYNPMANQLMTSIAAAMRRQLWRAPNEHQITLKMLGRESLHYNGKPVRLTRRQFEVICLLTLHPDGLNASQLANALYGDDPHSRSTIKAEISYLKRILPNAITSRPYKLCVPIEADFLRAWQMIESGEHGHALNLLRGGFFPSTTSPELTHWRYCLEAAISLSLRKCNELSSVLQFARHHPEHEEALQRIVELTPS